MKKMTLMLLPAVAAALVLSGRPAAAQVTLNLLAPAQAGQVGDTFQFFGTLTNFGPSAVYLLNDSHTGLPAGVTFDDSPFAFNAPSVLSAAGTGGSTYTGELFDITVAPGAAPGFYSGLFALYGGADPIGDENTVLNMNGFSVAAVPEASTTLSFGLLLALGAGGLLAARKKPAS